VREGDLRAAQRAYREAERRAPSADKAEIASRLGWLAKESGDSGSARRYFAKARGDGPLIPVATIVIAATAIVSLVVLFTAEGPDLLQVLWLDKVAVAAGEYWRLWTVTLVHADLLHLFFNMYALYLAGPIVERWYGSWWFLILYLACAAAGSVASFVFGGDVPAVGASGAIFGLFGVLLAANRVHHPVDRATRGLISQLGFLVLLNLVFGFASGGQIDNAAHLGGLFAGLWLGAAIQPTGVPTMSAMWRRTAGAAATRTGAAATGPLAALGTEAPRYLPALAVGVVVVVVVAGLFVGTAAREDGVAVVAPVGATAIGAPPGAIAVAGIGRAGPSAPD
jgi:membrane associated rhomboid family serine protease